MKKTIAIILVLLIEVAKVLKITKARERVKINLTAVMAGNDLCVVITGGELPHIGAVALSLPRKSLSDPERLSSSTSVLTVLGHKEDTVAKKTAETLVTKLNKTVVVSCGIHLEEITSSEINIVIELLEEIIEELIQTLTHDYCCNNLT
jgi:hypothetical protein